MSTAVLIWFCLKRGKAKDESRDFKNELSIWSWKSSLIVIFSCIWGFMMLSRITACSLLIALLSREDFAYYNDNALKVYRLELEWCKAVVDFVIVWVILSINVLFYIFISCRNDTWNLYYCSSKDETTPREMPMGNSE